MEIIKEIFNFFSFFDLGYIFVTILSVLKCSRKGFVMSTASSDELKIISGETYLNKYQWNTEIAEHYFCSKCGINTHHKRRSDPKQYGYNIACIEGFEMSWIKDAPYVDNTKMSVIKKNKVK